jgi:hypothetical protein
MNLDDGAVYRKSIDFETDHLLLLQSFENLVKHAVFAPAAHAGVYAVPLAESAWKSPPFASMFEDVQHRVQHREVVNCDIASLTRKDIGYFFVLLLCYFHRATITKKYWPSK